MKKVILILTLLFTFSITAQDSIPKMQLKYNGFRAVDKDSLNSYIVLEFPNKTKSILYKNSLVYLNSVYKNPKNVLNTVPNEAIIINGATNSIKGGLYWHTWDTYYTIKLQFKDGKIKFEPKVTDITELDDGNSVKKIYLANTDSPNKVEINCIYMKSNKSAGYFLFHKDLKSNFDKWINSYIYNFIKGINENNW